MVLQGLSLSVEAGDVVALLGRNGAGKTTTLRSIMGLTPPRSGYIRLEGVEIAGEPPHQIARLGIGYVPDDRRIFPDLTVEENLELARRVSPRKQGPWTLARVYDLFPVLREYRSRGGTQLSGGEQKMLALGRALVQNPRLLLLDEAVEGLAPLIVQEFVRVIREISASGITILLADQNLKFALQVAQRGYIIDKGRIAYYDEMERIWANEEIVRRYLAV
jgi:branched-chain amino acid transport system ATP-binding protein